MQGQALGAVTSRRLSAAEEICNMLDCLASRAEGAVDDMGRKLSPITSMPGLCTGQGGEPVRTYPPLFDDLRYKIDRISAALDNINEIMQRVEL